VSPVSRLVSLRPWLKVGLALALAGGAVAGLAWVGEQAGLSVAGRDRYAVKVADISCDSPPGTDRATFLTEVRYLGDLPETVQTVDPGTPDRLTAAFAVHPWVASVERIAVTPEGEIHAALRFRVPVLKVTVSGEPTPRVVDATGVLLPLTAPTVGLAELAGEVFPPAVQAGKPWLDPDVKRAAELAQTFGAKRVEKTDKGWRITQAGGKVLLVGW
jgi:hypothetical protein